LFVFLHRRARGFVKSLKRAKPAVSLYSFASQLSGVGTGLSLDDAYGIVKFLASLYRYRSEVQLSPKSFLSSFIAAAKEEVRSLPDVAKINRAAFEKNIEDVLTAEQSLALTAKASELSAEHQRRLCPRNCRILSDARPIFVGDPSKDPSAVLVQHAFKIAYHEDDADIKEFYVTMDKDDVLYLQTILARAEDKEKSLRRIIKRTGIPVLGDEDSE
jgi:hypothetical protein